jgi:hypothetical protein
MAKQKKKTTAPPKLSPENYIRQKSRTLPVHECLINNDWESEGLANILISRSHTNGNFTVCTYLVDLKLLGVKDTLHIFNIDEEKYNELKETYYHQFTVVEPISYTLAHNIIFGAVAFAEEFEFKPHKDFTSTTEFFLEEDDDNIELMDLEFGQDGKPLYINGPYDSPAKIDKILQQLERTAGSGNYEFHYMNDDDWDDEEEDGYGEDEDDAYEGDDDDEWTEAEEVK